MKGLLQELIQSGALDAFTDDDHHLADLLHALSLLRRGAIQAAVRDLRRVDRWGPREIALLQNWAGRELLLNALAEEYHHSFKGFEDARLALLFGALLGGDAGGIKEYYRTATEFYTRVVGLEYEDRADRLHGLRPGDPVTLVWEPENPHDDNAISVRDGHGGRLGYLRRTLAKVLVERVKRTGASLEGQVACILSEGYPADERLYVRVKIGHQPVNETGQETGR